MPNQQLSQVGDAYPSCFRATWNSVCVAAAGETNVYEVGCTQPKETAPAMDSAWQACTNRRVVCKKGFLDGPHNATCLPLWA